MSRSAPTKARSSSSTDELIEALLDAKLVEALAAALSPYITKLIDSHVSARFDALDKSLNELKALGEATKKSNDTLKQEAVGLRRSCEVLKEENALLKNAAGRAGGASRRPRRLLPLRQPHHQGSA